MKIWKNFFIVPKQNKIRSNFNRAICSSWVTQYVSFGSSRRRLCFECGCIALLSSPWPDTITEPVVYVVLLQHSAEDVSRLLPERVYFTNKLIERMDKLVSKDANLFSFHQRMCLVRTLFKGLLIIHILWTREYDPMANLNDDKATWRCCACIIFTFSNVVV